MTLALGLWALPVLTPCPAAAEETAAMSADQTDPVACTAGVPLPAGWAEALCADLAQALDGRDLPGGLQVTLVVTEARPALLKAHLRWQSPGGVPQESRTLTLGIQDADLAPGRFAPLVAALLQVSDLG